MRVAAVFTDSLADILDSLRSWRVWSELAREDIFDQHKRTILGPAWLLINYLCFVGTFVLLFQASASDPQFYVAYVAVGLLTWNFMSEVISSSVGLFSREQALIKGTTLPLSAYVFKLIVQNVIRFIYASAGCIFILLISGHDFVPANALILISVLVLISVAPAVSAALAILGAFFPDLSFIVSNIIRLGMFLTPIFWQYQAENTMRHTLYIYNPFTYFIEILRAPILYGKLEVGPLGVCIVMGLLIWVIALGLLGRFRREVVYVL